MVIKNNEIKNIFSDFFSKNNFLLFSLLLTLLFCSFHFWIAYPGYYNWDSISLMLDRYSNLEPVSMTYVFLGLFKLFGNHIWIGLLLSVIPFYLGLWVLSLAFYKRYNSWWALLLFFPMFIQNIFVSNFILLNTSYLANFSFLMYSIILYFILNPAKQKNILLIIIAVIMYILSIFVRHNGIIQVCIAPLIVIYLYLRDLNLTKKQFILRYLSLTLCAALISVSIAIIPSKVLPIWREPFPPAHIFANQLAGICVPADDSFCFNGKWYVKGKNWSDLKKSFYLYPVNANQLSFLNTSSKVIEPGLMKSEEIRQKYLYAIKKYPLNWFKHEFRLIYTICLEPARFAENLPFNDSKSPFYYSFNSDMNMENFENNLFPDNELYLHRTPLKLKLLHIWDDYLPKIPTISWIIFLFISSITSVFLLFKNRFKNRVIIVYSFLLSIGGFGAAIIYGGFYPEPAYRYMYPLWVYGVLGTVAYVVFCIDNNLFKNFKDIIKQKLKR